MDEELDDAALWAVIDSAAASHTSSFNSPTAITTTASTTLKFGRPQLSLKCSPHLKSPSPKPLLVNRKYPSASPSASISTTPSARVSSTDDFNRPLKFPRNSSPNSSSPQQLNVNSPIVKYRGCDDYTSLRHCLANQFPTVSLFKDYQEAAMSILEKSDYIVISGNPFIKKSGWRKIAFYFNVSFEIRDKTIEFDDNRNVQRAEFVARAYMQGGRFSDGWGSCERREKKFLKPNHDIPSTAETRAKNRACQDLLGIGQYRPGVHHSHPR